MSENITSNKDKLVFQLNNLVEGTIIKRPSKIIKSPYVADIIFEKNKEINEILGHTASLGCCGLSNVGAKVLISKLPEIKKKRKTDQVVKPKCDYRVYLSLFQDKERNLETIIGIHPKLAEEIVEQSLLKNYLSKLQNIKTYKRETSIYVKGKVDSRFDFSGIDKNGIPFIMEVKNVPLADYEDVDSKMRKNKCYDNCDPTSKIAYFPDGYRKKKTDTVSPRALKHIQELTLIKRETNTRCIMCYVIQRSDVSSFQPSIVDPEYRQAFKTAMESGVEIITMVIQWTIFGEAFFVTDHLPINSF